MASFIAYNNCSLCNDNSASYLEEMDSIIRACSDECSWMYETAHIDPKQQSLFSIAHGTINYIVWSEVLICPHCGSENVFWDLAQSTDDDTVQTVYHCKHCNSEILKRKCQRAIDTYFDESLEKAVSVVKFVPVLMLLTVLYSGTSKSMPRVSKSS